MQQSLHQVEASASPREYHIDNSFSEQQHHIPSTEGNRTIYFENEANSFQASAYLHELHDFFAEQYGDANNSGQSCAPNTSLETERYISEDLKSFVPALRFLSSDKSGILGGNGNDIGPSIRSVELVRTDDHVPQQTNPQSYRMCHTATSPASPALLSVQDPSYPSSRHKAAQTQAAGQSSFAPFSGLFKSSDDAKRHRHTKMRFDRSAYNESDPTIADIEADRPRHVERIYNAMVRGDVARDNYKSVAMKRWVREPHYPPDLVEAYAHKVFDCLLEQAKDGFRGWHHNDYVVDDRKGNDEDRDIDCEGRLDNIILALEQEKTICEDVMNSACQIRMFVNAPVAYSNRKHQNRVGNSKRPNSGAKDELDSNPRASKARKIAGKRARNHSPTVSSLPLMTEVAPQQPHNTAEPSHIVVTTSKPPIPDPMTRHYCTTQAPSHSRYSTSAQHLSPLVPQHRVNLVSQPAVSPQTILYTPQLPHTPGLSPMSPTFSVPFSPPPLSYGRFSAPATPEDLTPAGTRLQSIPSKHPDIYGTSSRAAVPQIIQADELLFAQLKGQAQNTLPHTSCEVAVSANLFEQFPEMGVSLADIEQPPSNHVGTNIANGGDFSAFWP